MQDMRRSLVQGLTKPESISEIVCYLAGSNHAKFHAFILKMNNLAIFWTIIAVLHNITLASTRCEDSSVLRVPTSQSCAHRLYIEDSTLHRHKRSNEQSKMVLFVEHM